LSSETSVFRGHPERLLVIAAHPWDADRAMAGSVISWVGRGTMARLVCGTSGDGSSSQADADPLELAARRENEQRSAAALAGYDGVTFLHRPEGALLNDLALREQLVRLIRTYRPDAIAVPDPTVLFPETGGVQHVDHREVGLAGADATHPAASAMAFAHLVSSESLEPHDVKRIYLYWSARVDFIVDIEASLEAKLAVLREHESRLVDGDGLEGRVRASARRSGALLGLEAAEAFSVVDLD
jgi:LmbE family N-acetylglucosaminyl deacetylase